MIPAKTIEELILKHSTLEKDLSSGEIDKKLFAEKSTEYSDLNEIIINAKKYYLRKDWDDNNYGDDYASTIIRVTESGKILSNQVRSFSNFSSSWCSTNS